MSADKDKLAARCWQTGNDALGRENFDYSVEMYRQAIKHSPSVLVYRQSLRGAETRKYGNNGSGARMASMKLMKPRARVKRAQMQKNWEAVLEAAEDGLAINPWDAQLNAAVGEACRELDYGEVATWAYKKAVESDPDNRNYLRSLAQLLQERGEFIDAGRIWERIQKIDPLDAEARTKAHQCLTQDVIEHRGYEGAEDTKGVMADHEIQRRLGKTASGAPADGPGMSLEADLERAVRKEPENKDHHLKLAEFYRRAGKLEEARQSFTTALELSGGDANIREQIEDVELDMMRQNVEAAKVAAVKSGDAEAKEQAKAMSAELLKREISVLQTRIERYPADLHKKFELGLRYYRIKKHALAIPLLQQSVKDTRLEVPALVTLGKCFIAEKKGSLALRQFLKAINVGINPIDQPDLFKEAHYWAGRLSEEAGKIEDAESHYSEVLAHDYEYKDTLARLEGLQGDDD
jgi:tetratricopeptide (TPR) repeat protein